MVLVSDQVTAASGSLPDEEEEAGPHGDDGEEEDDEDEGSEGEEDEVGLSYLMKEGIQVSHWSGVGWGVTELSEQLPVPVKG